jgi:hypothetical protein
VITGLHISFAQSKKRHGGTPSKSRKHMDPQVSFGAEECVRVDDSGKRVFVGRGEVSFAHRQCSVFDFDHIGVSPQHSSTFLQLVAPMVFDFVESALPDAPQPEERSSSNHHQHSLKGWALDSPRRRSSVASSRASTAAAAAQHANSSSFTSSHHSSNTVFVYGHAATDRLELYRFIAEHIADAASNQVRSKNLKHANSRSGHDAAGDVDLLDLSFSLVDAYHVWGIADVLDPSSFLHDVNGSRTLNVMKRSNGSKGLPFVMPTRKALAKFPSSVGDDVSEVTSAVHLRRGLKILYRQAEVIDHKQSSSSIMSFFCASRQRSSVLHVVLLPEADASSSMNRVGTQLSAVSTTLQQLQQLSTSTHGDESASFGQPHPNDTSSVQTQNAQSTRVPMRESPVLMYLMQTEDYYQNERAARYQVAAHNRLLDDELSRLNSDASFSRKHIPSTTPHRQPPIAQVIGTPYSHGFPALPSASLAHNALGNVVLVIAVNCAVEHYAHVLSACHFARRARPRGHQQNLSWVQGDTSTTSLTMGHLAAGLSSKGSSPGRNDFANDELPAYRPVRRTPEDGSLPVRSHEGHGSPKDPLGVTQAQRSHHYFYEDQEQQSNRFHNRLPHGEDDHNDRNYDESVGGSHEPSSIEHSRVVASRDVTVHEHSTVSQGHEVFSDHVDSQEETSIERTYRQAAAATTSSADWRRTTTVDVLKTSTTYDTYTGHQIAVVTSEKITPDVSPARLHRSTGHDASTMVMLSPASPASTQTDSLQHLHASIQTTVANQDVLAVGVPDIYVSSASQTSEVTREQRQLFAPLHTELPVNVPPARTEPDDADDDDFEALANNIATMGELLERESPSLANPKPHATEDGSATATATPCEVSTSPPGPEASREGAISTVASSQRYGGGGGRLESPQFDFDIPEMDDFMSRSQSAARGHIPTQLQSSRGDANSSKGGNGWWSSKSSVVSSKQFERQEEIPSEAGDGDLRVHEGELVKSIFAETTARLSPSPRQPRIVGSKSAAELIDSVATFTSPAPPAAQYSGGRIGSSMSSYPMIVERLTFERDSLSAQVKRLQRELSQSQTSNEELREALTERQDHVRRLSSKLEDLSNHRQLVADELVNSHTVQQRFFKDQLDEAVARHEATMHSMQQTIITLSKEKMGLEREYVKLREDVMNQSRQTVACETLQSHINVLHAQIEHLNSQHEKERDELAGDARQWKRKAEGLLHELSMCRAAQHEHEVAAELRKTEEKMKVEILVEHKIRDAVQNQAAMLDGERRSRLASEHEAFQLRLHIQALTSRLAFFEEQVAPEVDLSIKELEEQMQKMHEHRTRFQRSLHSTLARSSVSSTTSPAKGNDAADGNSSLELLP